MHAGENSHPLSSIAVVQFSLFSLHLIGQNPGQVLLYMSIPLDTQKLSSLHPSKCVSPSHSNSSSPQGTLHVTGHIAPVEPFVGPIYITVHVFKRFNICTT